MKPTLANLAGYLEFRVLSSPLLLLAHIRDLAGLIHYMAYNHQLQFLYDN